MITSIIGILVFLASVLLVLVVMVQNSKGGGLDSSFGAVSQINNAAQSTDTVEKGTWYLAAVIAGLCLLSTWVGRPTPNQGGSAEGFDGTTTVNE
ncbi:MAG: preprotein translocase subunit SecG [Parvicella sp.]|jgi:preprotein translocase subunit SecG